tara:strand:- start:132 stop:602 length:471 start_codon:yes stop_codon:yes gene_type:complete
MKLTANITLNELTKSQVAERKGINNNPNPQQIDNLKALATNVLQPIRSHYDKPLIISSGFRCAELCIAIGSSVNSQHVADDNAAAADFEIPGVDNRELAKYIRSELEYDQLILEFYRDGEPTSGWIHCSYSTNHNRNQSLRAFREDGKVVYKPWIE